jgi:hypothetical protein
MGGDARQSALRCRANGCKQGAKGDGEYGEREEEAGRGRGGGAAPPCRQLLSARRRRRSPCRRAAAPPCRPTPEALSRGRGRGRGPAGAVGPAWVGERGGIRIGADSDARGDRTNLEMHAGLRRRFACSSSSTYVSERMNLSRERNI